MKTAVLIVVPSVLNLLNDVDFRGVWPEQMYHIILCQKYFLQSSAFST